MQKIKIILSLSLTSILGLVIVSQSHAADGNFQKNHPRRAQVVNRANTQKNKNNAAAVNGQINNKQAKQLDHQDNAIKAQEQRQAAQNGGHITKAEQRKDNREENHVTNERNRDEKRDAAKSSASGSTPAAGGASNTAAPAAAPAAAAAPTTTGQ